MPSNNYPIPHHDTWNIMDSSKLQTYMDCPRKYFYNYMLGWRGQGSGIDANFGSAMHVALEHFSLLQKNSPGRDITDQDIADAYMLFLESYRANHPPDEDEFNKPKNPQTALDALTAYADEYNWKDKKEVVHYTETAGSALIDVGRLIHFRFDLIVSTPERGLFVRDYKTSKRRSDLWAASFEIKTQMGTYTHAAKCLFPEEHVWGIEIRGIFLYKTSRSADRKYGNVDFWDVPIRKDRAMMEVWRWNTIQWLDRVAEDTERLAKCDSEAPVLGAFPMNTESCTKYGICPFHDFCTVWPNPLSRCSEPPMGFEVSWWNPADQETTVTNTVGTIDITK